MDENTNKLLTELNNNVSEMLASQKDIQEKLTTILMAIYDLDFTPSDTDTSDIMKGLKAIATLLKNIEEKQHPYRNPLTCDNVNK